MSQPMIVVGLDHTPAGVAALGYAIERAEAVNGRLWVIHVVPTPETRHSPLERDPEGSRTAERRHACDWVFDVLSTSEASVPLLVETIEGSPADVLTEASTEAAALVVGTPDSPGTVVTDEILVALRRNVRCLLIEVSATSGVARASGPLTAAPPQLQAARGRAASTGNTSVVVGFDGSVGSVDAFAWALEHARTCGADVEVVAAYRARAGQPVADVRSNAQQALTRALRDAEPHPGVAVTSRLVEGEPVGVLTLAAADATMLVLGRHGTSGMLRSAMGSVGDSCSRLADCPVTIVPAGAGARREESRLASAAS